MNDYLDPAIGLTVALLAWALLGILTLADRRKARR